MKIGFVIGTYGTPSYVELGIRKLLSFGVSPEDIFVIDDASGNEKLPVICKELGVGFESNEKNLGHFPGDFHVFSRAADWGFVKGYDLVVKVSRRFICLQDPRPSPEALHERFNASCYGTRNAVLGLPLRTEFVALNVDHWMFFIKELDQQLCDTSRRPGTFEDWFEEIVRKVQTLHVRSSKNVSHDELKKFGFIYWDFVHFNVSYRTDLQLWHFANEPKDYFEAAKSVGMNCSIEDFEYGSRGHFSINGRTVW